MPEDILSAYEELRCQVLDPSGGPWSEAGLALMMRNGMVAWAKACSAVRRRKTQDVAATSEAKEALTEERPQLVNLLVQMVVGRYQQEQNL